MMFINPLHSLRALILTLCLALWLAPATSWGEDELADDETQELYSGFQPDISTASRIPKPLSQTAENTTVITAKEIEQLNAHTLADILDTVPGIQVQHNGGPGILSYVYIQSGNLFFNQVLLDGVPINNLSNNFPDIFSIPATIIDRIEIVKGAASYAWGSGLAGVINVITKSPEKGRAIAGSASASIGERTTADTRVELTGTVDRLGYYLSGGYLGSNGLIPKTEIGSRQVHAKLTYDLPDNGLIWATLTYNHASMGDVYVKEWSAGPSFNERADRTNLVTSLGLRYTLAEGLELELLGKHYYTPVTYGYFNASDGAPFNGWAPDHYRDQNSGVGARLLWRTGNNLLAVGSDYSHQEVKYFQNYSLKADRWGAYLNDTLTLGMFSISPGLRFDHTETNGDQISSSLGLTWQATDSTLLRAYTGRGFNVPFLNPFDVVTKKIWTTQVGAESTAIPYLWVKGTLFRNMSWGNGVAPDNYDTKQVLALGSELELRTIPVFHTSLGASWTYTQTTRTSDGTQVRGGDTPTNTIKLALRYDDGTYRGTLLGSHINWNTQIDDHGNYGGMLWDLHLGATLLKREDSSLELFFSGHNLFNSNFQGPEPLFMSIGRWFEGGMRVRF